MVLIWDQVHRKHLYIVLHGKGGYRLYTSNVWNDNINISMNYIKVGDNKYNLISIINGQKTTITTLTNDDLNSCGDSIHLFKYRRYEYYPSNNTHTLIRDYHPFNTIRIRNFKIYNNLDECVLNLIPVLDRSNIACMYDLINNEYFYDPDGRSFSYNASFEKPLTFTAAETNSSVVLKAVGTPNTSKLKYRRNLTDVWETYTVDSIPIELQEIRDVNNIPGNWDVINI